MPVTSTVELEPMADEDTKRVEKRVVALEVEMKAEFRSVRDDLNEQRLWAAKHDGEIKEKWRNQDKINEDNATKIAEARAKHLAQKDKPGEETEQPAAEPAEAAKES